ncbi:Aste57867_63 [Aphanomyces stellatus]|uniref:Aste57867_63 protein n=1 Tax=Aphanomyces stellatus TaxID=120398 RepID=A0A485K6L6_9STRA|nr:hypothetical protein As57867_000063 [Aphanomyces stellatus]VFT77289.1 Aste57867_63 [Aphanomyces stellatus]
MANPSELPYVQETSGETLGLKRKFLVHLVLIVLLAVNVIVLYVLHFADNSTNVKVTSDSFASAPSDISNKVVSFNDDGSIRAGAGTTAYLDAAPLPSDDLGYFYVARSGLTTSNTALVSYYLSNKTTSVLTTLTVGKDNTASLAAAAPANVVPKVQFQGLATLNDKQAVVLESAAGNISAVLATIGADKSVSYVTANRAAVATGSFSNTIGRISATQFAITSFEPYVDENTTYYQTINVGTVSGDGAITMAAPLRFGFANGAGDANVNSKPQQVPAIPGGFLVTYFNTKAINASGLCVLLASVNASGVTQQDQVCNKLYQPVYFLDTTTLADNLIALAFYDKNNNNALTIATVGVSSAGKLVFRGDYVMQSAAGAFDFGSFYSWYPKPNVQSLGSNRLAVLFLNPANAGRPTTQVFKVSESFALTPVTPLMRLSNGDFTLTGTTPKAISGVVTLDLLPISNTTYVATYSGKLNQVAHKRVSVVEFLGKPIGVGSSSKSIVMSGAAKVDNADFTAGKEYFATTKGDILVATSTDAGADYYFVGNTTVVSKDSRVGVAVTKNTIYVSSTL